MKSRKCNGCQLALICMANGMPDPDFTLIRPNVSICMECHRAWARYPGGESFLIEGKWKRCRHIYTGEDYGCDACEVYEEHEIDEAY